MDWKKKFIEFSYKKKLLNFGTFKLKSGRISPYFFNSGLLSTGKDIIQIGLFYANSIIESKVKFDMLFGAAYKGIPIVVATSIALKKYYNLNIPYFFNRKEPKNYGEKGEFIGNNIYDKNIIILDDVITSGHTIHHTIQMIERKRAKISSIFVLLDRQEQEKTYANTIQSIKNKKKYKIISIITIEDLIHYILNSNKLQNHIPELIKYRNKYSIFRK